jgi:flagellar protein FliL
MLGKLFKKKSKAPEAEGEDAAAAAADTAAPKGADGEGAEAGGKKKPPLKLIIIAAVAGVVILGGGGTAAFLLLGKPAAHEAGKPEKAEKKEKKEKKERKPGKDENGVEIAEGPDGVMFYTLPSMVVNMQTADGRPTFLKLKLTLELADESIADEIDPNLPRLTDMFQMFLRELRPEDLQGSQGGYQLRMEILRRVNLVIAPAKVNSVLIEEMLIN